MSKIEVLVTTMNATDFSKYFEMNLQTDVVIANQSDSFNYEECIINGNKVKMITTNTKGTSVNRNIAITYSTADILIFADDDMFFSDVYADIVADYFVNNPSVEAIKFSYSIENREDRYNKELIVTELTKAKLNNCMSTGVPALAIKRSTLIKNNLLFSIGIGPGTKYYCGEDSVFLKELLDKKVKFYLSPAVLAHINQDDSTWFTGYDEKYFVTTGYIYANLYGHFAGLFSLRKAIIFKKRKL